MTTANKITLTRIAMIPFFIYFAAQPMLNVEEYKVGIFSFPTCTVRTCTGAAFPMKRLSETGIEAFRPIFRGSTVTGKRRSSIRS